MNRFRVAVVARDLNAAERQLAAAGRVARSADEKAQLKRSQVLAEQLALFYQAVRAGIKQLEPADELPIGDDFVAVVESGPDRVTLHVEGSQHEYTVTTLPSKIALVVAEGGASKKYPKVKVFFAAFLAVDPAGDPAEARQLLAAAAAGGVPVDDLLPFLEPRALAVVRDPSPDQQALAKAAQALEQKFAEQLAAAKTRPARAALAAKLLAAADETDNGPDHYAALARSRDLAVAAGEMSTALKSVDELARWFEVDPWPLKNEALTAAVATATPQTAAAIGEAALDLSAEAAPAQPAVAITLTDTAIAAARKARDTDLLKRARARREELAPAKSKAAKSASPKR